MLKEIGKKRRVSMKRGNFENLGKKFFKIAFQQRRDYLPRILRLLDRTWIVETKW